MTVGIIGDATSLAGLAARVESASVVALDVEANGLFAFRARLCTLQLGIHDLVAEADAAAAAGTADASAVPNVGSHGTTFLPDHVAVVDTIAVAPTELAHALGPRGPRKVLHDLTFDARMLAEANIVLGNVFDTSVAARMLGRKETGLASLLASELGIVLSKDLQQHNWGLRPLTPRQIEYVAADVLHLAALESRFVAEAVRLDVLAEIAEECRYKLMTALGPPREDRPMYLRVRGSDKLDPVGLGVLKRLVETREELSERADLPPFKTIGNEALLEIARKKPTAIADIASIRGVPRWARRTFLESLAAAVRLGIVDGGPPPDDRPTLPRIDRSIRAERRAREVRLTTWRRAEAKSRGVDEQAVLPGHCISDLATLDGRDSESIALVAGFGIVRIEKYAAAIAAVLRGDAITPQLPEGASSSPPPP